MSVNIDPNVPPDPRIIEQEAELMPQKINLSDYCGAMTELRSKGYSYGDIAKWLSGRLGIEVRRGQVYWIVNGPPDEGDRYDDEDEAAKEAESG